MREERGHRALLTGPCYPPPRGHTLFALAWHELPDTDTGFFLLSQKMGPGGSNQAGRLLSAASWIQILLWSGYRRQQVACATHTAETPAYASTPHVFARTIL